MKRILLLTAVLYAALMSAHCQPRHSGVLANWQFEGQGSGNGAITGVEAQHVQPLKRINLVTTGQATFDRKGYREQNGLAIRVRTLARYSLPAFDKRLFLQGGVYFGAVRYSDTPGQQDAYAKFVLQPAFGGGAQVGVDDVSVIVNYAYLPRSKIHAQRAFFDSAGRGLDGHTAGQRVGLEAALPINRSRWLFLLNASHGRYYYQRSVERYGPAAAQFRHRYSVTEISIGVGRKSGK